MPTPTYNLITSQTLEFPISTITIGSLPSTYKDLIVVCNVSVTGSENFLGLRFNSSSANAYNFVAYGNGGNSTPQETGVNAAQIYSFMTTTKGTYIIHFMDYRSTSKHRSAVAVGGNPSTRATSLTTLSFNDSGAMGSITLLGGGGFSMAAGSVFEVYGVIG